jgi:uncharacterized protein YydD (DUF2326 family)
MIYSIKSNNPKFKSVTFHSGYNVVLADRSNAVINEKKQTRNGAGKTTLVEIIHFCLGSTVPKTSIFKNDHLKGWSFILTLDIDGKPYSIERYTDFPNKMYISGELEALDFDYKYDDKVHQYYVSTTIFNKSMLNMVYGITATKEKTNPTFRELISYSVRRNIEGYRNAFEFYSRQNAYSIQVCNAYFLDLNIEYASEFQSIKDKKKGIDNYKSAALSGAIGAFKLNIGELSTEVITHQKDVDALKNQLEAFQVHPQYEDISKQANVLTEQIHSLTNTSILRQQLLERYEVSSTEEAKDLSIAGIEKIYAEVGVLFGDSIRRPLSEVMKFHKTIVSNRSEYLANEIASLEKEISGIEGQIKELSDKRAKAMKILETHGALDEYILMQDRYAEAKQQLEELKEQLKSAEYIEDSKSHLKIENQELLLKTRQDYNERIQTREQAISLFKENTEFLYPEGGTLTIDLKETGYSFGVDIKSSKSQGVNYMKVFCYDLVLAQLGKAKKRFPDFLVHDSTIFDGVDERQVARALMLAETKCKELGFQYICLMNSDTVPLQEFDHEFAEIFNESIILRISDDQDEGGLLGIRF